MKINDLNKFIENKNDQIAFKIMTELGEDVLNNTIETLLYAYIKAFNLNSQQIAVIKLTLRQSNEDSFGSICVYTYLVQYIEEIFKKLPDFDEIIFGAIQSLIKYLSRQVLKSQFLEKLYTIQEAVGISDNFYNGLIDYFSSRKNTIILPVINKLSINSNSCSYDDVISNTNRYEYDEDSYHSYGGGYNSKGYNSDGFDANGLNEYGYDEDWNGVDD